MADEHVAPERCQTLRVLTFRSVRTRNGKSLIDEISAIPLIPIPPIPIKCSFRIDETVCR